MRSLLVEAKKARELLRREGVRAVFRRYGWRLAVIIFMYYLIRDLTIYVLIPMFVFRAL